MKKWLPMFVALVFLLIACTDLKREKMEEATLKQNATIISSFPFSCDALFFGDSITCDGNFDELFPTLRIVNLGVYGDTLEDLLRRVPEVREQHPKKIFLLGGINSLGPDNVEDCLTAYAELLDALRAACPKAELIVQSVLPIGSEVDWNGEINEAVRRFNEGLKKLAEQKGISFVDLYAVYEKNGCLDPALTRDGVHLNYNAYGPWAETVAPYMPSN